VLTKDQQKEALLFEPCQDKESLHLWIKAYFGIDIPDCMVDEKSTGTMMEMVWECYKHFLKPDADDNSRILYYASRDSGKTLGQSIFESLALLHLGCNIVHLASIEEQSKNAQRYIRNFLRKAPMNKFLVGTNAREVIVTRFRHFETKENRNKISEMLGCEPVLIDSSLVSAQSRKRLYWTNIPINTMPSDKGLFLKDIVINREDKMDFNCTQRVLNKISGTLAKEKAVKNTRTLGNKSKCLMCGQNISNTGATNIFYEDTSDYFIPTPVECERLQTIPDNYTEGISNTQRYKCIGNGWTVDVIAHILSGLKE